MVACRQGCPRITAAKSVHHIVSGKTDVGKPVILHLEELACFTPKAQHVDDVHGHSEERPAAQVFHVSRYFSGPSQRRTGLRQKRQWPRWFKRLLFHPG